MIKKFSLVLLIILWATSGHAADLRDVIFSELMWMGDFEGTSHEWIELYNTTDQPVDIEGWQITRLNNGVAEELMLTIPSGIIPAKGYFLIANNPAGKTNMAVEPDFVDRSVSLLNNRLQIKLYDGQWDDGKLIDIADDGVGEPASGDNESKRSMVRVMPPKDGTLADSWRTAELQQGWDEKAKEYGTPRNSRMIDISQVGTHNKIPALWAGIK